MAISKFWLDVSGGMMGVGGLVALQSLSTIKKGTSHFNVQSNEPFSKFLLKLLRYEVPGYGEKYTLCPHRSLLRQRYCAAYDKIIIDTQKKGRPRSTYTL